MKDNVRQAVAFIAGKVSTGRSTNAIFDYSLNQYVSFSGDVNSRSVSIFDYSSGAHIAGTLPNLFHYGEGAHISLDIKGAQFQGFDYGTSTHFTGSVSATGVSVFDYGQGKYFQYSL